MTADEELEQAKSEDIRARAVEYERQLCFGLPPRARDNDFDDDEPLQQRVTRKNAIVEALGVWSERRVVLTGTSGSGKTSLAAAMLREWRKPPAAARFVRRGGVWAACYKLVQARRRFPLGEGECPTVQEAIEAKLLVLDDLGDALDPTDTLRDIVFEREERDAMLWVTTWMTPDQMSKRYGDGFARRIFENAAIIDCGAP